jgi:hypothetical protein
LSANDFFTNQALIQENPTPFTSTLALLTNLAHDPRVRGAPLLRTLFVILGLALAIVPLWKITHRPAKVIVPTTAPQTLASEKKQLCLFTLTLSHPAASIQIKNAAGTVLWQQIESPNTTEFSATLTHIPPTIFLSITWAPQSSPAGRYFAKLRLDPPARASLTHTFDSSTDIDDIWELP